MKNITEVLQGKQEFDTTSKVALSVQVTPKNLVISHPYKVIGTVVFLAVLGYIGKKTLREMEDMQDPDISVFGKLLK